MRFVPSNPRLFVSDEGAVLVYGIREQKQYMDSDGYRCFDLRVDGKKKRIRVHRLVAEVYCAGYALGMCVNHLDGNKLNNRAENLEWTTLSRNTHHAHATGLNKQRGASNGNSKLSAKDVSNIRYRIANGDVLSQIARDYSITRTTVCDIKSGKRWLSYELAEGGE